MKNRYVTIAAVLVGLALIFGPQFLPDEINPIAPKTHPGAWVVIVGDPDQTTVQESIVKNSEFVKTINDRGQFRYWSRNDLEENKPDLVGPVDEAGLPAFSFVEKDGEIIATDHLETYEQFVERTKEVLGE